MTDAHGQQVLNHAHVEVHVRDEFGNDLPDYEVVYLLESLGTTLGASQGASSTYLPLAYLTDFDTSNLVDGVPYDLRTVRARTPMSRRRAPIRSGPSWVRAAHRSFFFNQWLGAGAGGSTKNVDAGIGTLRRPVDVDASGNPITQTVPGFVKSVRVPGFGFGDYHR